MAETDNLAITICIEENPKPASTLTLSPNVPHKLPAMRTNIIAIFFLFKLLYSFLLICTIVSKSYLRIQQSIIKRISADNL